MTPTCDLERPDRHDQAGFTLVEMLVSLAIMAMISTVMIIGISRMDLRHRLAGTRDAQIDEIADAQFTLRHRIAEILPTSNPQTGSTIDFGGTEFAMEFDGAPPDNASPDAFQRYRLRLERSGDLMLYRLNSLNETIDKRQSAVDGWVATRILSGVAAFSIRYFGPAPDSLGNGGVISRWQNRWSNRKVLPSLVGLRLEFPSGDKRSWPDLVVRLRAANGDACDRDLLTDDCKGNI